MFNSKKLKFRPRYNPQNKYKSARAAYPKFKQKNSFYSRFAKYLIIIIVLSALGFFTYLMLFSGFFGIKEINLKEQNIENQQLIEQIRQTLKTSIGQNIFFADVNELEQNILKQAPELEEVNINKNLPDTLEVEFRQYALTANIINESSSLKKSYIINSIGYAVKEDFEDPQLPYIRIKSDQIINPKKAVIEKEKLEYIVNSIQYFQDKFGMRIVETEYKPIAREIRLLTERDFRIWLDIQVPYEDQLKKLKKALIKLDIFTESLEYIDLRIAGNNGDKIIYKRR